jgi:hypothetical protein
MLISYTYLLLHLESFLFLGGGNGGGEFQTVPESPLKEAPISSSSSSASSSNELLRNGGGGGGNNMLLSSPSMGTITAPPPPPPSLTPNTYLIQLPEVERKKAIINTMSIWMDTAAGDFLEDRPAYIKLERFIQNMIPVAKQMSVPEEAKQVEEALLGLKGKMQVKFLRHWTSRNSYQDVRKTPLSNSMVSGTLTTARKRTFTVEEMQQTTQGGLGGSPQQMDQFGPEELAQQLALIHYDLVAKIKAKEFVRQAWNKPGMDQNAPNVIACIKRLNWVRFLKEKEKRGGIVHTLHIHTIFTLSKGSNWYSTMILKGERPEQRAQLLNTFIKIAEVSPSTLLLLFFFANKHVHNRNVR